MLIQVLLVFFFLKNIFLYDWKIYGNKQFTCHHLLKTINLTIYLLEQFFRQGNFFSAYLICFGEKLHTQLFHFWNKDLMPDSKLRILTTLPKAILTREVIYMITNSTRQLCVFFSGNSYPVNIPNFIFDCIYFSLNDWCKGK